MNENEYRRRELLEQTRMLYHENQKCPAVHPRYRAAYRELYEDGEKGKSSGFTTRLGIALILFVLFATADLNGVEYKGYDCEAVVQMIGENIR